MRLVPMIPLRGYDGHKAAFASFHTDVIKRASRSYFEFLIQRYDGLFQTFLDAQWEQGSTDVHCPACRCDFTTGRWESGSCPKCGNTFTFDERCTQDYSDCWQEVEWEHHSEN